MTIPSLAFLSLLASSVDSSHAQNSSNLNQLLNEAISQNFTIKSLTEDSRAEKSMIISESSLADPSIGISRLNRGLSTEYFTLQQKIRFPTKYFLAGRSQRKTYESSQSSLGASKLKIRKNVIGTYYALYAVQKTIQLTRANLQLVKDFARIAEQKYAARKAKQSESMKAHFEMTKLELNLLNLEQEESMLHSKMSTLLGRSGSDKLELAGMELESPKVFLQKIKDSDQAIKTQLLKTSPTLKAQSKKLESSKIKHKLAKWEFAPDFTIQYQKQISGLPEDSDILSISASVPLWFWKNSANASSASARYFAEDYKYKNLNLKFVENLKALKSRIQRANKVLIVYRTTLMPQAEGAYRSSRSAYKAGGSSFLDLLDAERSLYSVKQSYYKALTFFVEDILEAETILGASISNLSGMEKGL